MVEEHDAVYLGRFAGAAKELSRRRRLVDREICGAGGYGGTASGRTGSSSPAFIAPPRPPLRDGSGLTGLGFSGGRGGGGRRGRVFRAKKIY